MPSEKKPVTKGHILYDSMSSLVAQTVKHLPTMRETRVQSLGQEDPLEKEMATHSSTLTWKTPWMEEPHRLQSVESQRVRHNWVTSPHLYILVRKIEFLFAGNKHWRCLREDGILLSGTFFSLSRDSGPRRKEQETSRPSLSHQAKLPSLPTPL